jgi:hypothetical protein
VGTFSGYSFPNHDHIRELAQISELSDKIFEHTTFIHFLILKTITQIGSRASEKKSWNFATSGLPRFTSSKLQPQYEQAYRVQSLLLQQSIPDSGTEVLWGRKLW